LVPQVANAHNTEFHDTGVNVAADGLPDSNKIPINVGGYFELVNHHGELVTNLSYTGKHMLVFFGYTNCRNMCSLTLARIGKAMEILGDTIEKLHPVIITVDPERDTPETMKTELSKYHSSLIGHTGNPEQLLEVYGNYNQNPESAGVDWNNEPIVLHTSYIFLMDEHGKFVTLFPPILNPQSMADIIGKYVNGAS
jgi:protein SCO1/2